VSDRLRNDCGVGIELNELRSIIRSEHRDRTS
jgi:hypothetical protein